MRVLWFTNIIISEAAIALDLPQTNYGGWMSSNLTALQEHAPEIKLLIASAGEKTKLISNSAISFATFRGPSPTSNCNSISDSSAREIENLIDQYRPDIIHIHGTENYYGLLDERIFKKRPILISLQGILNGCWPHYNGSISPVELRPHHKMLRELFLKDSIAIQQKYWSNIRVKNEKQSFLLGQHFTGRTDWDLSWAQALNPRMRYYHLDEVMRSEFYKINREQSLVAPFTIYCSSAAGYPMKGLHWLLRAVAILLPSFPGIQVRIADAERVFSTPHGFKARLKDREYSSYLRGLVHELGLEGVVVGLPQLNATQVAEELARAHLFCLPSLCENSPNSLAEAMLAGTPAVACHVGGIPSMLKSEEEGLLCPPADPASLASAIAFLFQNQDVAGRFAAKARSTALVRHDPIRIAQDTRNIYNELVRID